jgi:hypothetical protein
MAKVTITEIGSTLTNSAAAAINENFSRVQDAIENTLSRDGTAPNNMTADLDLDGNDIVNVDNVYTEVLVLGGKTVTPSDLSQIPATVMLKSVYDPQSKSADAFDSANIDFIQSEIDTVERSVRDKLRERLTVKDFGAVCDGITNDNAAVALMASSVGYVVFPRGDCLLTTTTISVPVFFLENGAITGVGGQIITFQNRIVAPKQHIFKGSCTIIFNINDPTGEDSKSSHIAWWGVFPRGQDTTTVTAEINRALDAYEGETREGIVEFDNGSYRIDGTITIPRGVWIKGSGTRRTIFDLVGSGYTAFQSGGSAIRISGIQFEQPIGSEAYFDGIQIDLQHDTPVVEDVRIWNAKIGVNIGPNASAAVLRDVIGNYPNEPGGGYPAGSALIMVHGDRASIDNARIVGSTFGPESVVNIGQGSSSAVTNTGIVNIQTNEKSIPVKIVADTNDVLNVNINGVLYFGDVANNIPACVDIVTSGTASVQNVLASNVLSNSISASLLRISQGSSGLTDTIVLSSGAAYTSSTKAADLTRTAGTLSNIIIGGAVNAVKSATPITKSGSMSNIIVPAFMDNTTGTITIADDAVGSFTPPVTGGRFEIVNMGSGGVFPNVAHTGCIAFDVGGTPAIEKQSSGGANLIALGTAVPTGTTGIDGNTNIASVSDGKIYIENRSGGSVTYRWRIV